MNNNNGASKATVWFIIGFIVLVTAGVIIAGAYSSSSSSATASSTTPGFVATLAPAITAADHTEGNAKAKVTLIEYGDFECPACGEYYPLVKQIVADYGNQIQFVFRNFPLYSIHPDAGIGAQAAEAAASQGKFWQMYDLLYTKQLEWSTTDPTQVVSKYFDGYATSLGLDTSKFNTDIGSNAVLNKIKTDVDGGNSASIDHTPTFFINLKQIPNPNNYTEFKADIDAALAAANGTSTASSSGVEVNVGNGSSSEVMVTSTPL